MPAVTTLTADKRLHCGALQRYNLVPYTLAPDLERFCSPDIEASRTFAEVCACKLLRSLSRLRDLAVLASTALTPIKACTVALCDSANEPGCDTWLELPKFRVTASKVLLTFAEVCSSQLGQPEQLVRPGHAWKHRPERLHCGTLRQRDKFPDHEHFTTARLSTAEAGTHLC